MKTANRFTLLQFLLVLGCTNFFYQAIASPISREQALQNAQAFLRAKGKNISQSSLRHAPSKSATGTTESYYVFNVGDNAGYVVAAGDDCVPTILGYADTGTVDPNNMPSNMKAWLEEYTSQIKYMQEKGVASTDELVLTATHPAISPLLTTTWDQTDPYNQNCPDFFTYGKSVTGCVATAMAQVMYYHRAKSVTAITATIPAYTCRHKWISGSDTLRIYVDAIPAGSPIDWNNMLNSYSSSATTTQQQAVANLMKYCGAAVEMDYANAWNGGSGAYSSDVPNALKNYFNYSDQTVLKYRNNYSSADDWDNLIYNELSNSRPVFYSGSNSSGGHAFVCDGYDGKGYYHINWGWSGTSDGYFLLSALDPDTQGTGGSSAGYNNNQTAVIYAEPKSSTPPVVTGITFSDSNVKTLCLSNWDSNGDGQLTEKEAAAVTSLGIVFKNNTSIKTFSELQYFTGLTSIVASAFEGCTALTSVTIPANVTAINSSAFKNCSKLSSMTIPAKVTTIGSSAFYGCSSLTSISIPASVTNITSGAFSYCSGLTNMTVASGNTTYNSNNNCKAIIKTSGNQLIAGCKNTVIPSTVNTIGSYAFQGMTGLTAITIPAGVISIASYAFDGCSALTSVTVENSSPVSIASSVFSNRTNATLYVPAGCKTAYAAANYWKEFKEIIEPTTPSSDIITFADANVKTLCVANWDTDGDGELSENEAAAVTDLGTVFKSNSTITSFGELQYFTGLTSIGNNSFYNCSQLSLVIIPKSVTSIGSWALASCNGLTTITIPSSVTSIGSRAFWGCKGLTSITIPSSVTSISNSAFFNCSSLTSITVDSNNTVYHSRDNCNAIIETSTNTLIIGCKNTIIPLSVTSIGNEAFYQCSGLTSITIPSNVTSIGSNAFGNCSGLASISVNSNNTVYDSRDNCNAIIEKSSNTLIVGCKNTTIPSSVTGIGNNAFYQCSGLTSIIIPLSVTSIGNHAFDTCSGLTTITIPSSVTSIGSYAFNYCNGLTSITIPSSVTSIGSRAFCGCSGLVSITIPSSVTSIGNYAFSYFSKLTSVTVEWTEPLTIEEKVFYSSNTSNATLYVPSGSKSAYEAADYWKEFKEIVEQSTPSSKNITFADANVKALCVANWDTNGDGELSEAEAAAVTDLESVFKFNSKITSFEELQYFTGLTSIGSSAFSGCSGLTSISIPSIVTSIGIGAFQNCSGLTSITIPSSVTSIGSFAFSGCSGLTSITIPSSVTSIGSSAFHGCSGLASITIPSSVTSIGIGAFENCSGLASISVNSSNTVYDSRDNCNAIIEKSSNTLIAGCKNTKIPSSVTSIGSYAFSGCSGLTSITIPSSVTSIGNYAFYGCSGLASITIPSSVTTIGTNAFAYCSGLASMSVNSSNTVYDSRDNCNAIIEKSSNTLIAGCKNTKIPSSVTSIGNYAFRDCRGLASITIPSSVTSIGSSAFQKCSGLTSITIPSKVKSIGGHAFYGCSGLTSITIPSSVTSIGNYAFALCSKLASVNVEWSNPLAIAEKVFYSSNTSNATLYVPAGSKATYEVADYWKDFKEIVEIEVEKYTLEVYGDVGIDLNESHLYDRDGNEYDYIGSGDNEFDEGSYIRISPFVGASLYIQEIIVNGESVGTWTEDNAPTEYVIESLSENTTVEFRTYLRAQWRTLGCIAEGPGKVEMYKNGNLIGTTSSPENYFSDVFECGDVIKLVLVPDAGSTLTQFLGGEYGSEEALRENLLGEITDNSYSFTFNPDDIVNKYGYLVRFFKATFEGPEPSITNTLSASVPTLLLGKQATLSLNLKNEDELIACEFDLQLPDGITIAKDEDGDPIATLSSRASKHSLAVSDKGNGLYHFLCYSNSNKAFSGNEGELLSIELLCDGNIAVGTYQATIKNIIFSDVDKNKIAPADYTFDLEVIEAEPGDVNNDGEINVMDVVEMVAYIMGDGSEGFVFAAADLYPDGAINVMDLVNLVELIMNSSASNAREWTENSMSLSTLSDGAVSVKVNNPEQYVASEFIVEVSAGQALETVTADKHHRVTCSQLDDSHYKVMTYSSANSTFNSDALVQLHISGEGMVNVHDALLVDESRKGVAFAPAVGGYTTGINQMENGKLIIENSSVYDLQGKKRDTSRPYKHEVLIVNGKKQVVR